MRSYMEWLTGGDIEEKQALAWNSGFRLSGLDTSGVGDEQKIMLVEAYKAGIDVRIVEMGQLVSSEAGACLDPDCPDVIAFKKALEENSVQNFALGKTQVGLTEEFSEEHVKTCKGCKSYSGQPMNEVAIITEARKKKGKKKLPPVKDTGFWVDKFGEGGIKEASVDALYAHAKNHPGGIVGGIRSLGLLSAYGSFPKSKMDGLWEKYNKSKETKGKGKDKGKKKD